MRLLLVMALVASSLGIQRSYAQDTNHDGAVTFLIPINVTTKTPGAYGTLWLSEFWFHNGFSTPIGFGFCHGSPCRTHPPGVTDQAFLGEPFSRIGPVMLNLLPDELSKLDMSSRLFELSRHTQPAGVHMPIVREDRFFSRPARFVGVNGSAANRVALRVYDPRRVAGSAVRVDMLTVTGTVIASTVLPLQYTACDPPDLCGREPGYAATYDLAAAFPQLSGMDRYDIVITPLTPGMEYWALVSVTDVETQQVLLITAD